mmetsp:Transcript_22797/g.53224  ORF Transcript_22797/g.53224 Transcript_22797/m.53224 type:complete len:422 (+) Transcript_22797:65-1330(+)
MPSKSSECWQLAAAAGTSFCAGIAATVLIQRWRSRAGGGAKSSRDAVLSGNDVLVDAADLQAVAAACLEKAGCTKAHAQLSAEVLVAADRRNVPSHGVNRCEHYCDEIEAGLVDGKATPTVELIGPGTCLVDGHNGLGSVVSKFAMEKCIELAKANGVGFVVCHRSNHFGIAGFWSQMALDKGLLGFAFTNTSPFMIPTRGTQRAVGTNPICCFCPGAQGDCFQLDMATTTVPIGKVEVMYRKQQSIPRGWGVNAAGEVTGSAEAVIRGGGLTPVGGMEETAGYKGYGLGMLVEILTSVLGGSVHIGPGVPKWTKTRGVALDYCHCFMCVDPQRFAPGFEDRLSTYLNTMRSHPASASAAGSVLVPGDPERSAESSSAKQGVRLNEAVAASMRRLAARQGVPLPKVLQEVKAAKEVDHLMQ